MATVKVQSVRKLVNHVVRIHCHTENDATKIKELNWTELLEGVKCSVTCIVPVCEAVLPIWRRQSWKALYF